MRYRRSIALGLIGILLVLVVFAPASPDKRWLITLHDVAHGPIFGCLALLMLLVLRGNARRKQFSTTRPYLLAFAATVALGVATEVAQALTGRDSSFADAGRDTLGAAAFLLLFAVFDRHMGRGAGSVAVRSAFVVAAAGLLAILAMPLVTALDEYRLRDRRFPVLAEFSREPDRYFVAENRAEATVVAMPMQWAATPRESTLQVRFLSRNYPGVEIAEPVRRWRGYSTLAVDVTNPTGSPLEIGLLVQDARSTYQYGDAFNATLRLEPQTRRGFRIAAGARARSRRHRIRRAVPLGVASERDVRLARVAGVRRAAAR
jgi:VanZ family protein